MTVAVPIFMIVTVVMIISIFVTVAMIVLMTSSMIVTVTTLTVVVVMSVAMDIFGPDLLERVVLPLGQCFRHGSFGSTVDGDAVSTEP